jgi:site-specific recombinase XerD
MKSSSMKELVKEYLDYRRKVGYKLLRQGYLLEEFARFADSCQHQGSLKTDLMIEWATKTKDKNPKYHSMRLQIVTKFAKYRSIHDPKTEVPPRGILGRVQGRSQLVVYSDQQMNKLLEKIRLHKTQNNFTRETYETLLGLLLCTGLRISEALNLMEAEVDLREGILRVVETKFSKSRLVPLHKTAVEALKIYQKKRDEKFPRRFTNAFFVNDKGCAMTYGGLQSRFWKFKQKSGLQKDLMASNPFHCFRHTFAMRRLIKWHRKGEDTEQRIAALSTYMGHVKVSDTYWYFHAIPELLELVSKRFERLSQYNTGTFQ